MCLAIYKPAGVVLPEVSIINAWDHNRDGAGFMVVNNGALEVHKGFFSVATLLDAWRPLAHLEAAVHLRFATHGAKGVAGCHPYEIRPGLSLIHNGVLHDYLPPKGEARSDSALFASALSAADVTADHFRDPKFVEALELDLNSRNKLIIMDAGGLVAIVNEASGLWESGVWYSNTDFRDFADQLIGCTVHAPRPRKPRRKRANVGRKPRQTAAKRAWWFEEVEALCDWCGDPECFGCGPSSVRLDSIGSCEECGDRDPGDLLRCERCRIESCAACWFGRDSIADPDLCRVCRVSQRTGSVKSGRN